MLSNLHNSISPSLYSPRGIDDWDVAIAVVAAVVRPPDVVDGEGKAKKF